MSYQIRKAVPDDAKGIAKAKIASWRAGYQHIVPDIHLKELSVKSETNKLKFYITASQTSDTCFFVAEQDGQIIGFVTVGLMRDDDRFDAEIYAIYIDPDHFGRGVGTALFQQALDYMREKGWQNFALWVLRDNKNGIKFYKKMGMQHQADADKEIMIGCENLMECLYTSDIS